MSSCGRSNDPEQCGTSDDSVYTVYVDNFPHSEEVGLMEK